MVDLHLNSKEASPIKNLGLVAEEVVSQVKLEILIA
jgi:hypothetical protein